jgi:hypothetical protein
MTSLAFSQVHKKNSRGICEMQLTAKFASQYISASFGITTLPNFNNKETP